jgi:CO/xanthine dehydrogenase FAD-binding subunit
MLFNLVEYHWAEHIDDAMLLLSRLDVKTVPLAGGTYLLSLNDDSIQAVVDLRDLGLNYITEDTRGVHIGAMTTLQNMADSPLLKNLAMGLLARAALVSSSSRLIRNCATLGGTLGVGAHSQADLLTALTVMDAEVVLRSNSKSLVNLSGGTLEHPGLALSGVTLRGKQERRVPSRELSMERRPSELIVEVIIPHPAAGCGTSFMRIGRTSGDVALLNAAALIEVSNGAYQRVRLVIGGVNMEPIHLESVERQLEGQAVADNHEESQRLLTVLREGIANFRPPSDFRASSGYRRVSGMNLAYRAFEEAMNTSHWHSVISSEGIA